MASEEMLKALDPASNVIVSACAGSGKTWLLASRILRILLASDDARPRDILAITFTREAAAEIEMRIQERVRNLYETADDAKLDEQLAEIGLENPDDVLRKRARSLYHLCLLSRPGLAVSTFHSWYAHLRRGLAWDAHGRGGSRMTSGYDLQTRAFMQLLKQASDGDLGKHFEYLMRILGVDALRPLLGSVAEKRLSFRARYGGHIDDEQAVQKCVKQMLDEIPEGMTDDELAADDDFRKECSKLHASIEQIEKKLDVGIGEPGWISSMRTALFTQKKTRRENLKKKYATNCEKAWEALERADLIEIASQAARFNEAALTVAVKFCKLYADLKRSESAKDFNDVELDVWEKLETESAAPAQLQERLDSYYRHILIDEFQDTNLPQWAIVRNWLNSVHGTDNEPSVFIVGDLKQSIYGFRGAQPKIMKAAEKFLRERYGLKFFPTDTTRRCASSIIDVVNKTFAETDELDSFSPHKTMREGSHPGAVVVLHPDRNEDELADQKPEFMRNSLVDDPPLEKPAIRASAEAEELADLIRTALDEWGIEQSNGSMRACKPDDILVLYPTRARSEEIARALLSRGIPCSLPDSKVRLEALECADVIALMLAVCDPAHTLHVMHALRTPALGCDESDLLALHAAGSDAQLGKRTNVHAGLVRASENGSPALKRAAKLLGRWRKLYLNAKLPAHEMLAAIYHDSDLINRYLRATPKELALRCVRNLEMMLNSALSGDQANVSLYSYARRMQRMRALKVQDSDDSSSARTARLPGTVALMTLHSSKGLEAPIVALAQANHLPRNESYQALAGWPPEKDVPEHFSICRGRKHATEQQLRWWKEAEDARVRERANMLYVGMTRARQVLIVSAHTSNRMTVQWRDAVADALGKLGASMNASGQTVYGKLPLAQAGVRDERAEQQWEQAVAVSKSHGTSDPEQTRMQRRGEQLHNLIALKLGGADDERLLRKILGVKQEQLDELQQDAQRMLSCEQFVRLQDKAENIELELPITSADGSAVLRIDCLLELKDEVWVVDFKSPYDATAAKYRKQLQGYQAALEAFGETRPIRAAVLAGSGKLDELPNTTPAES